MSERLAYQVQEAADVLGVSRRQVERLMREGRLRYVLAGARKRLIPAAAIGEFLGNKG